MAEEKGNYTPATPDNQFTIKYIAGTGSNAQYWRLADKLVRGSRIFKKLCKKIYVLSATIGTKNRSIAHQKQKVKDLTQGFRQYEKEVDREFKKEAKKLDKVTKMLATANRTIERWRMRHKSAIMDNRKISSRNKKITKQLAQNKQFEGFVTKEFTWRIKGNTNSDQYRAELMLRAIFGFKELEEKGEITYHEICYLAMASQIDAFSRKHVYSRFGTSLSKFFNREMASMMEKGWMKRFDRKDLYYITDEGRKQFRKVISLVYSKKYGHYWKRIFNEKEQE